MVIVTTKCRHNWIFYVMLSLGLVFIIVGCAGVYRTLGVPDEQAANQGALDEAAITAAVTEGMTEFTNQLAAGQPLPAAAASAGSALAWKLATILLGGAGTIISTLLAKWLGTERKITSSIIRGVEKGDKPGIKESIKAEAMSAGVEVALHKRVTALTSA